MGKSLITMSAFAACLAFGDRAGSQVAAEASAHYARVERELLRADVARLTVQQRAERKRLIAVLRAYRLRGDFGINVRFPDERKPHFVDADGRRCAVANLLDHSGLGALTRQVAQSANYAWVVELAGNATFRAWLRRSGLTLREAARIQYPPTRWRDLIPPPVSDDRDMVGTDDVREEAEEVDRGSSGASRGGARPIPARGPQRQAVRGARGGITLADAIDWKRWWQLGRLEFLRPHRLGNSKATVTGRGDIEVLGRDTRRQARSRVLPLLRAALRDDSAIVRASAARAIGRIGADEDIARLKQAMKDTNQSVRESAILGLGALASPRAAHALLAIVHKGQPSDRISPFARPLAILALGLAKQYGAKTSAGSVLASLLHGEKLEGNRRLASAAMVHQLLAPSKRLDALAGHLATDARRQVRGNALEALGKVASRANVAVLTRALSGRRIELRRSAATALGRTTHALALPALMTAFESEREQVTRAFLTLAIGRHADPNARSLLLESLRDGRRSLRPWSAIALAIQVRGQNDRAVQAAIRRARLKERNREAVAAYLIASGISGDAKAVPELVELLSDGSAELRISAAEALAMIGGPVARDSLVAQLGKDKCSGTRAMIAEVLGFVGNADDADLLAQELRENKDTGARARLALALGFLGNADACGVLEEVVANAKESSLVRAAAIEGIACTASEKPSFVLAQTASRMNFVEFPGWLARVVAFTM